MYVFFCVPDKLDLVILNRYLQVKEKCITAMTLPAIDVLVIKMTHHTKVTRCVSSVIKDTWTRMNCTNIYEKIISTVTSVMSMAHKITSSKYNEIQKEPF